MPESSTTEGWCIQGELKDLLEDAAVQRAESSASLRQGCPLEHRATPSRRIREASVRTERTRDGTPAAPDRLDDEQRRRDRRARLEERVHRGYHPRREGRYDSEEDQSPSPNHQVRESSVGPCGLPAGVPVGRDGRRQPHHPQPPPFPLRRCPGMAGASASCADLRLGRPSQGLRGKFPRYVRAPWELMGSPKLPPAARGIPARVHPTVFQAAHRVAQLKVPYAREQDLNVA
jgi:hypothetical protein